MASCKSWKICSQPGWRVAGSPGPLLPSLQSSQEHSTPNKMHHRQTFYLESVSGSHIMTSTLCLLPVQAVLALVTASCLPPAAPAGHPSATGDLAIDSAHPGIPGIPGALGSFLSRGSTGGTRGDGGPTNPPLSAKTALHPRWDRANRSGSSSSGCALPTACCLPVCVLVFSAHLVTPRQEILPTTSPTPAPP